MNNNQNNISGIDNITNIETLDDIDLQDNKENANQSFIKPVEENVQNTNQLLESVPKPDIMISSPTSNLLSIDDLVEEYIGNNYEKISKRKVNLSAFFFTGAYFIYRKMVFEGILICIISLISFYALLLLNPLICLIAPLIIATISFVLFNKLYLSSCRKKVNNIKNKNKNKSVSDLKSICVRKGGTNIVLAIVISIFISGIITLIFNTLFPLNIEDLKENINRSMSIFKSSSNKNTQNNNGNTSKTTNKLDIIYDKDIVLSDLIDMGYLQIFKATDSNNDYSYDYKKQLIPDNDNSYCAFNLSVVKNYSSSVELINEMANYYNASDTVTTKKTTNEYTWNLFTIQEDKKTIYASIEDSDHVYLFKYVMDAEVPEFASAYETGILNSINFK